MKNNKENTDKKPAYFICYLDYAKTIDKLDDVEAGKLLKALYHYSCSNIEDDLSDYPRADTLFDVMQNSINREFEKYNEKCEKNQKNAKKGGAPKGNQNAKKSTVISEDEYTEKKKKDLLSSMSE